MQVFVAHEKMSLSPLIRFTMLKINSSRHQIFMAATKTKIGNTQQRNFTNGWTQSLFAHETMVKRASNQISSLKPKQPSGFPQMKVNHYSTRSAKVERLEVPVASGKGGVGKSTTAVNLAIALSMHNKKVALLDADIYGPSIPMLMNLSGVEPEYNEKTHGITPLVNYGIKCMSVGFLTAEEKAPFIWRGPMVMSALEQLLKQTDWGTTDVMVVDLPPGTGDIQLTICQRVPLTGAVIVCTPQDLALLDAVRSVNMFKKLHVPIMGIVENMSHHVCSKCGEVSYIFGKDGAKRTAEELGVNFLGEVPLHTRIRETSDAGKPITILEPDSPQAAAYKEIGQKVVNMLQDPNFLEQTEFVIPTITVE